MSRRAKSQFSPDTGNATARELVKATPLTCLGCAHLRQYPRPMCKGEASPFFRMVRDTYHQRCQAFAVSGVQASEPAAQPIAPPTHVRIVTRGR